MSISSWIKQRKERKAVEEHNEIMYDESNLTKAQKLKRRAKETWDRVKYPAALLATIGGIYGSGIYSQAKITPLGFHDVNGDGKSDAIMAFPLRGTGKSLVCYMDGADIEKKTYWPMTPSAIDTSLFNLHSLDTLIDAEYSNFKGYAITEVRKKDYSDPNSHKELVITVTPGPQRSETYFPPRDIAKIKLERAK